MQDRKSTFTRGGGTWDRESWDGRDIETRSGECTDGEVFEVESTYGDTFGQIRTKQKGR